MGRVASLFAFVAMTAVSTAQPFATSFDKLWGGALFDTFRAVQVDSTGNVYAFGVSELNASLRVHRLIKYGPTGGILWSVDTQNSATTRIQLSLLGAVLISQSERVEGGLNLALITRHEPSTGSVLWQKLDVGLVSVDPAIAASRTASIVTLNNSPAITCRSNSSGATIWTASVPISNVETLVADPAGDFVVRFRESSGTTFVRKVSGANGATLWERSFQGILETSGPGIAVMAPSGNVVLAGGAQAGARFELLSGNNGDTLRVDPIAPGVASAYRSLGDSYYGITGDFATRVQFRDKNGYLFGFGATNETFDVGAVDGNARLLAIIDRSSGGFFKPRVSRELGGFQEFLSLAGVLDTNIFDNAAAGAFVAAAGQADLANGSVQARVILQKQNFEVVPDTFAYRKGQILNVGAPGFFFNDAVWSTGSVTLTQPNGGTVVLNSDKSFSFTPNVGFFEFTSFTYAVRVGASVKLATVSLVPLTIAAVDIAIDDIVGGNNLTGKVVLSTTNPFHNLVVQLSENITGLAVTSSIQIPQGSNEGTFNIITVPVAADSTGNITARLDNVTVSRAFTVKRATPVTLNLNPSNLVGGKPFVGTISMNGKAPAGGYVVNVTHSGTDLSVPFANTVPANASTVTFNGTTQARSTSVTRQLTAASGGVSVTANLTINPGGLFAFTITPTTVKGGVSANGNVQTAGVAPAGGTVINMAKDGGNVSVPATVTVAAGTQFKNFTMTTSAVTTTVTRTITATFGTIVKTGTLTITP